MVEGPTAVLPVPTTLLSVCKALTAPIPRVVQGVGDGFHINPDSPMNNVNYEFVVHSGADMASLIKAATKQPVYELPVMTPPGEAPTDWSSPESLRKILPETYLLAHMYLGMFPQSLDANDPYSHHRLLAQNPNQPGPHRGLLKDTLAITMKPTYRLSDYVSTLNSSLYGKLMFTLSGSAAKALGLPTWPAASIQRRSQTTRQGR
ncbi:hypothetical protein GHT06_003792 [Daphnia sinensis]|uniref:Uncharacterized protein n=1 Tax=Daphnia sinensis TaxID=1820382 RepID=A0AAD5KDL2_9CRUS|nr:hypothetical protein GHT06_003792 [Daphnia sinensis]